METFDVVAGLTTLAALFAWINHRWVRLPTAIGLMVIALVLSLALVVLGLAGWNVSAPLVTMVGAVDFDRALLHGMLGALLFAGALHVNLDDLLEQRWVIGLLATVGLLVSTLVVGGLTWWGFSLVGIDVPLLHCFLFGALISPTDPIAVMAILHRAGVPHSVETKVVGESLFNDGVAVVVFGVILALASGEHAVSAGGVLELLAVEAGGGIVYGLVLGWVAYRMLRSVDNYQVEIFITLAVVTGGYALGHRLGVSAPLAMVLAGVLIGNHGRAFAMSQRTRERLDAFWELVDEILNAVLFVLIGVEVLVLQFGRAYFVAGLLAIPIVLGARWISVVLPVGVLRFRRAFSPGAVTILTWGGLRGGISVALALSLPTGAHRDLLVAVTYMVVSFSIIAQGLTLGPVAERVRRVGVEREA
ncbi:MAG: sodium:proton antiporter [Gemmatimonadetes bacterium]|nr:sodium:proton antiporter [Gemmatimonadota bacterium]